MSSDEDEKPVKREINSTRTANAECHSDSDGTQQNTQASAASGPLVTEIAGAEPENSEPDVIDLVDDDCPFE